MNAGERITQELTTKGGKSDRIEKGRWFSFTFPFWVLAPHRFYWYLSGKGLKEKKIKKIKKIGFYLK